jgi:lipoate-protein ligase B
MLWQPWLCRFHGFALNINTNLNHFNYIVPCGLVDKRMTSMTQELGKTISLEEVKPKVIKAFEEVFLKTRALINIEKGLSPQPSAISLQ